MLGKREVGLSEFKLVMFLQVSVNICKNVDYFGRNVFLSKRNRKSLKRYKPEWVCENFGLLSFQKYCVLTFGIPSRE